MLDRRIFGCIFDVQVREIPELYYWLDAVSNHAVCGILE